MFESYKYLSASTGTATSLTDANGVTKYTFDATVDFITNSIGTDNSVEYTDYKIVTTGITGTTGTLTYQYSHDGITWDTMLNSSGSTIVYTVNSSMGTVRVYNGVIKGNFERWNFSKGNTSAGTITISLVRS
jgi:hypothetical protein